MKIINYKTAHKFHPESQDLRFIWLTSHFDWILLILCSAFPAWYFWTTVFWAGYLKTIVSWAQYSLWARTCFYLMAPFLFRALMKSICSTKALNLILMISLIWLCRSFPEEFNSLEWIWNFWHRSWTCSLMNFFMRVFRILCGNLCTRS